MTGKSRMSWPTVVAGAAIIAAAAGGLGFWAGHNRPAQAPMTSSDDRKVLYWYDPMVPNQHFDKPGKSPFMDMQLVPRYAGEVEPAHGVRIDPGAMQSLGVRTAKVEFGRLAAGITASGVIAFNDRDVAVVQAKQSGFVERAYRRAVGDVLKPGDPLVDLHVPDWTAAIAEYLALKGKDAALEASARKRLGMLGVPEAAVHEAEARKTASTTFTIRSPIAGAVTALDVREGMTTAPGAPLATIRGISPVWLIVSVPQGQAAALSPGTPAKARLAAFSNETVEGKVESILPAANTASRAVEVRISLPNPSGRLRPGMTAEVNVSAGTQRDVLLVPSEAVVRTGARTLVFTDLGQGRFAPVDVEIGSTAGDRTEIVSGLSEGQMVVASGQFLIGSEASLSGALERLGSAPAPTKAAGDVYVSKGRVTTIDKAGVTLAHEPVPALNWPSMTMTFLWPPSGPNPSIKIGDAVEFSFRQGSAGYVLETISEAKQ